MNSTTQGMQKFLFKARAVALAGNIRKPYHQDLGNHALVETVAGAAGHLHSRREKFSLGNDLAYDVAESDIVADSQDNIHHSVTTARIDKLRIQDRLTAEVVLCRLESVYDANSYPGRKHARVLPTGSNIQGLLLDGKPCEFTLPRAFTLSDAEKQDFFAGRYDDNPDFFPGAIPAELHVPGFGTIYFAEWAWVHPDEEKRQQLNMLRLALGSDLGADLTVSSGDSDGSGWPP